ncbi:TcmI family type II polyketide cyclase [Kineosporia sp. J2-2]|uniref:TcmI family type II polyketide cyclase n=1 Tax=Kineosporia corallincola TaxID=2835133 RepID=A0ABS5TEL3_9ACTN|nr:TcmI family type II polyketide cyclase [Kineosporia corallincola]MBT0769501.1 TcmI family type II polyketide cyclase [Kineosporia corallincola]
MSHDKRFRQVIVARIRPGTEDAVAGIFRASDETDLPHAIGVRERSLYSLDDLYVHVIEFDKNADEAMSIGVRLPGFSDISEQLKPYIRPYLSTWRSPADASARQFYSWRPDR